MRRSPGQVLAATSHGLFFHTPWMLAVKHAYLHTATRLAASRYDVLIANSASDLGRLRAVNDDAVLLHNAVTPLGHFEAAGGDVLVLGRLARHKHVERVIAALAEPQLRDVVVHIVGPEWDVSPLELAQAAERHGVSDRVKLYGRLDREHLAAVARRCGLFVSASRYEGFGMSMIEAMSVPWEKKSRSARSSATNEALRFTSSLPSRSRWRGSTPVSSTQTVTPAPCVLTFQARCALMRLMFHWN